MIEYDEDEATLIATDSDGASQIVAYNVAPWFAKREQARERVISATRAFVSEALVPGMDWPVPEELFDAIEALDRLSEPKDDDLDEFGYRYGLPPGADRQGSALDRRSKP